MKLIAQEAFSWAHRGVDVEHFEKGAEIETEDQDLIDVSIQEGWAAPADGEAPAPTRRPRAKA
jgi:hypothetical protein